MNAFAPLLVAIVGVLSLFHGSVEMVTAVSFVVSGLFLWMVRFLDDPRTLKQKLVAVTLLNVLLLLVVVSLLPRVLCITDNGLVFFASTDVPLQSLGEVIGFTAVLVAGLAAIVHETNAIHTRIVCGLTMMTLASLAGWGRLLGQPVLCWADTGVGMSFTSAVCFWILGLTLFTSRFRGYYQG
jgi:hypothetical protein